MPADTPPPSFPLRDLIGFDIEMGEGTATATLEVCVGMLRSGREQREITLVHQRLD